MNQILDYTPNKGNGKSSGSDKIVHVFAVIMIIFAIVLIAGAGYNMYQRNKESKKVVAEEPKAKIEVTQQETDVIVKVSHTKAVEKIIYSWNNGKETTIKVTGEENVEESIPLPAGDNSLYIKVIDIDGGESTYDGEFSSETGADILNPVIKLEVTDEKKLKITATDETSLDFITYRWNNEEEVEVKATEEDNKKIEVEVEILRGENDITISAVDSNNNTTTESKKFTGLTKPEVTIVVAADKISAQITVAHEKGLKEIKVNLNGVDYPVPLENNPPSVMFGLNLVEGDNKIIVTATSIDNTETVATKEVNNSVQEPAVGTEPQISVEKTEDGQSIHYKASHQSGIKEVRLNINDMDIDLSSLGEMGASRTDIEFLVPLFDGNNKITFTVIPVDGVEKQEIKEIVK